MGKVAKIINVVIQTLAIIAIVLGLFSFYHDYKVMGHSHYNFVDKIKFYLVIVEILFFGYQFIHAIITSILKLAAKKFTILYTIFWGVFGLYAFSGIGIFIYAAAQNSSAEEDMVFMWFNAFGALILYYYAISIIELVKEYKKKE